MEVEQGRALASAFISMEELYKKQKKSVERCSDIAVSLCNAAGKAKEENERRAEEIIVHSAVVAAATAHDDARKIGRSLQDFFQIELRKLQLERMNFIENLVFEQWEVKQHMNEFTRAISATLCEHFATKEIVYKMLHLKEKVRINELPPVHPIVKKFAEIVSNPEKDETTNNLLVLVNDMITNIGKATKQQWSDGSKSLFALILDYGGPALAKQIRERIGGPALSTLYKIVRLPYLLPQRLEPLSFARAREFFDRLGVQGPFIFAVDATPVIPSLKIRSNKIYGIAQEEDLIVRTAEDIIQVAGDKSLQKTKLVNAFILAPVYLSEPIFVLALSPVIKGETSDTVANWYNQAIRMGLENNIRIIGVGADGDSKVRKFYLQTYSKNKLPGNCITLDYEGFDFAGEIKQINTHSTATVMQPDWKHLIKKWRNQLLNTRKILVMGNSVVLIEYLMEIYESFKLESGLWKSDVFVRDKQNVDAAMRILQPKVHACLSKSNDVLTKGLRVYLSIGYSLLQCFSDKSLTPRERARLGWQPVIFLRLWKKWILSQQYDADKHFISDQTYTDTILAGHSVILNMLIFAKHFPDIPFCPWYFGSDSCEVLFSYLRAFTKGKNNFSFLEMLDIAGRTMKLLELKHKGKLKSVKLPEVTWPVNLHAEIIEGMKNAEKDVLKTMEEMGMIPGLRAANVVYQNQRTGEITIMNAASSAFASDKSVFPDEQNIVTFEELFDLDNDILLSSLQKESTVTVEGIAEIIADSQKGTEKEQEEELDEGDPRNCEFHKIGSCRFQQEGFVEPLMTHWIGCEFPQCGKWLHELCLGVKFKNDEERNRYAFICPNHDCDPVEIFTEKVKATEKDKSVIHRNDGVFAQTSRQRKETQKQHRERNSEQYVEYKGEVYHIANFLSLQLGKAYVPSTGRLSRWLSTSRCDFYDSIDSRFNTDKAVFTLNNFVALFVPDIGLVVGRVIRIIRTLKASTSFPILHVDKDSKKLPGVIEVGILVFRGVEAESDHPPRAYMETAKYIWCNSRDCILVLHGEENNNKFLMTEEDQRLISDKLPALIAADSKRAKQEQIEKLEKISKLKAGDPKDMSVILLREVLMEMGVSFKSNDNKAKLIEKVLQARLVQNDTCDHNLGVLGPSTNSVNVPVEVPESSTSTNYYTKIHASIHTVSDTLFKEQENITIETEEVNLHRQLLVYFDFDLKKKLILLLHLLFIVSIVNVWCSEVSNMLKRIHLFLSKSLLIVFEELEKILYIVTQIFFIIIQLLYAVACVTVSNMLQSVFKGNTSSCDHAIATEL